MPIWLLSADEGAPSSRNIWLNLVYYGPARTSVQGSPTLAVPSREPSCTPARGSPPRGHTRLPRSPLAHTPCLPLPLDARSQVPLAACASVPTLILLLSKSRDSKQGRLGIGSRRVEGKSCQTRILGVFRTSAISKSLMVAKR